MMQEQEGEDEEVQFRLPINEQQLPLGFMERYFKKYYIQLDECVQWVGVHSNKLVMVGVARGHPVLQHNRIERVEYLWVDREVKGKKKRGGYKIQVGQVFCLVHLQDSTVLSIKGPINGTLIEVNTHLLNNPSLLHTSPMTEGYLAIINAGTHVHKQIDSRYLTHNPYLS